MNRSVLVEIISLLFVVLFLYTGSSKLTDHTLFKEQIAASPLLKPVAKYIALSLPFIEFLVVLLLFFPRWRLKGLKVSLMLMTLFTGYIIAILTFSENIPCSCGGVLELLSWKQHIAFNGFFIVIGIVGVIFERRIKKVSKIEWAEIGKSKLKLD